MNDICRGCRGLDTAFDHQNFTRTPLDFIVGNPKNKIWIVGINPQDDGNEDVRRENFLNYFLDRNTVAPYFHVFRHVSPWLYNEMMERNNIAHTDLVKCRTQGWVNNTPRAAKMIATCSEYLRIQLAMHKPDLLICNGLPVRENISKVVVPIISAESVEQRVNPVVDGVKERSAVVYKKYLGGVACDNNKLHKIMVLAFGTVGGNAHVTAGARRFIGNIIEETAESLGLL